MANPTMLYERNGRVHDRGARTLAEILVISGGRPQKEEVVMFRKNWRTERLLDVVNLALGAFLFLSPWIFGFFGFARHSAWATGLTFSIVSVAAIAEFTESEEWINLIIGLWVGLSPWVMGFHSETTTMWVHHIIGFAIALLAAVELWLVHRTPPQANV